MAKRTRRDTSPEEDVPTAAPMPAEEPRGKGSGAKKGGGGGGFPGALPVFAGLVAGVLAFAAAFLVGGKLGPADPYASLDAGGVHAARMLGAMDIDRWKLGFGTAKGVRDKARVLTEQKKKEAFAANENDYPQFEEALIRWYTGDPSPGSKWRMGLDFIYPLKDPADELSQKVRDAAISNAESVEPGAFVGAMIKIAATEALVMHPGDLPAAPAGQPVKRIGSTTVHDFTFKGRAARWYEHPMTNRVGQPEGSAVVILSTASVEPFPVASVAGAAGLLAFVGGFLAVTILAGGTKKALTQLAHDTDSISHGHFDTKVAIGGPGVVQQIGKGVQKIAAIAQSGAAAPPQVMVQEIVRAPVQEINEALSPSKSFQRPEELEIEATQKVSAELGNDYYDVVNVDDEHVGVFIADIPTHGAKSSMHMAAIRALFRANAKGQTSPAEVLKAINKSFAIDLPRGVYVTATYCIVNKTSGIVKVASAQHLPLVFWKLAKKASARLSSEGIALGLDPGPVFDKTIAEKAVQLEKGDRIMLFTDGAINARNAAGAQYGDERFYYVVNREAPKNSAACVNFVANDVDLFHEGAALLDDFTLVTLRKLR